MSRIQILRIFFLSLLLQNAGAGAFAQQADPAEPPQVSYSISAGDQVSIKVQPAEEFSQNLTVQPDGKIVLHLIGSIHVAGMSSGELQKYLEGKLAHYVTDPKVTVNIRKFAFRRVSIIGEIGRPGYYDYRDEMMLLELVSLAGGVSESAKSSRVRVLRKDASREDVILVDLEAVMKGDMSKDIALRPGDTVLVPKRRFAAGTRWMQNNVLPWMTFLSIIASTIIIAIVL